jgi:3-hydroxybutyrate dehydrogenase
MFSGAIWPFRIHMPDNPVQEKQPNLMLLPPERIGDVAVFLCSDAASGITGVALPVDGGWTAQ